MGNSVQSVAKTAVYAYGSPNFAESQREQQEVVTFLKANSAKLDIDSVVFEGGGAKVAAYLGAAEILEEVGLMNQVKRFAGTSGGALIAALLAVRMPVSEIKMIYEQQQRNWIMDAWFSWLSLIPNLLLYLGWNSSTKVEEVMRFALNSKFTDELRAKRIAAGNVENADAEVTFMDIYKKYGTELCVVSSNLSTRSLQYHHPKTTPDMPVASALRASIAIPVLCKPFRYGKAVLVDGGLMCNYPLHVFDGWYLSMRPEHSFFQNIGKLRTAFSTPNHKAIGFMVNSAEENCHVSDLLEGTTIDPSKIHFPDTRIRRQRSVWLNERITNMQNEKRLTKAGENFLSVLRTVDTCDDRKISLSEFKSTFEKAAISQEDLDLLFGRGQSLDSIFSSIDSIDRDGKLTFTEFSQSMQTKGVVFKSLLDNHAPNDISSLADFAISIVETVHRYTQLVFHKDCDVDRSARINVWYVQTTDFDLEQGDRDFLCQQGRLYCLKFLKKRVNKK